MGGSGGGSGGGTSTTTQAATIAPELQPFFKATGTRAEEFQAAAPLTPFAQPRIAGISPLSSTEQRAISASRSLGGRPIGESGALSTIARIPSLAGRRVDTGRITSAGRQRVSGADERIDFSPVQALAQRRVLGEDIVNRPGIQAARLAFRSGAQPNITSALAMRGLGRSTAVAPALARAEAEFLFPAVQAELGREERGLERELQAGITGIGVEERGLERRLGYDERGIQRELGAETTTAGFDERGIARDLQGTLATIPMQQAMGAAETSREFRAVDAQMKAGGVERSVEQGRLNAEQQDFLRRQALSEQALFGPLGSVLPSAVGQTSSTVSKQSGGGK